MTRHPIVLLATVACCPSTRTAPCLVADDCARALVDPYRRPTQDFSIEARGPGGRCAYHLPAASYRIPPAPPGPRVHEALP